MVTNGSYNLTTMNETKLTIQLDLLPDPINTSNISINIATSGSNYGQLKLLGASGKDGLARLNGGTEVIANIPSDVLFSASSWVISTPFMYILPS